MKIQQAYFGDKEGSHLLIATSLQDKELLNRLSYQTDAPPSTSVTYPFVSGGLVENYYVFTRTMPDYSAKRGGMVFSHCLIVPKEDIASLDNVAFLWRYFATEPIKDKGTLEAIDLPALPTFDSEKPAILDNLLQTLLENSKPVVFIGYENLEACIAYLWYHLPESLRLHFSFTMAGSPNEVVENPPTLVHTPKEREIMWQRFPTVAHSKANTNEIVEKFYALKAGKESPLQAFINDNDITFQKIAQFVELEKFYSLTQELQASTDLILCKRVINHINKFIPQTSRGTAIKQEVAGKLQSIVPKAGFQEVLALRNISLNSFENGQTILEEALQTWATQYLKPNSSLSYNEITQLLFETYQGDTPTWWNDLFHNHLKGICQTADKSKAQFLWQIWATEQQLLEPLGTYLKPTQEGLFLENKTKNLPTDFIEKLTHFCKTKSWYGLHAWAVPQCKPAEEAILTQLSIDKSTDLQKNLKTIAQAVGEASFMETATKYTQIELHKAVGELCLSKTHLLKDIEMENYNWQSIWYETALIANNFTDIVPNAQSLFWRLLDLTIEGQKVHQRLLQELSALLGDVYAYPQRSNIWEASPTDVCQNLLDKTCLHIFKDFKNISFQHLESPLLQYAQSDTFIQKNVIPANGKGCYVIDKIMYLEEVGKLDTTHLEKILEHHHYEIGYYERDYFVSLIKDKGFQNIYTLLKEHKDKNYYLRDVIRKVDNNNSWEEFVTDLWKSFLGVPKIKNEKRQEAYAKFEDWIDEGEFEKIFEMMRDKKDIFGDFKVFEDEYLYNFRDYTQTKKNEFKMALKTFINSKII
jgi:hypothetical protein